MKSERGSLLKRQSGKHEYKFADCLVNTELLRRITNMIIIDLNKMVRLLELEYMLYICIASSKCWVVGGFFLGISLRKKHACFDRFKA